MELTSLYVTTLVNLENKVSQHSKANSPDKKICTKCKQVFSNPSSCKRHMKICNLAEKKFTFKCSECFNAFSSSEMFLKHLRIQHVNIVLRNEKYVFGTNEEFKCWKLKMEKETASYFLKRSEHTNALTRISKREWYVCHRSGSFVSRGSGKRQVKRKGSNKCGFYCPAIISRYVDATGGSCVIHQSTHLGHSCEVNRLYLSQPEKELIAEQIFNGVPVPDILKNVRENASPTERLALTSLVDLRNIAHCYGLKIDPVQHHKDVISLNNWVKRIMNADSSPILIFKASGETEVTLPFLSDDDFALGIMNDAQEELLRLYGDELISIATTIGENEYNVHLTSVVVKDANWQGFPVAFLWSNCLSENLVEVFFTAIKERVYDINSKTLISDDCLAYYNVWHKVFGVVNHHLLCDWHVKRMWVENASSGPNCIKELAKRNEVLNILNSMSEEMDIHTFQCSLEINTSSWLEDPDTLHFAKYFMSKYANRTDLWARCYRGDVNVDMSLIAERWHKDLKYDDDLKGKSGGLLDQAIYNLMKSLRRKLLDQLISLSSTKLTKKLNKLRKCHRSAEEKFETIHVSPHESDENVWIVPSFSLEGITYKVKQLDISTHECNLYCSKCSKCLHQYCCNCLDSAVRYNFCKHIHVVCMNIQTSHKHSNFSNDDSTCKDNVEENSEMEQVSESDNLDLRQKACDAFDSFFPYLNTLTSNKAFEEVIRTMETLKSKLQAIEDKESSLSCDRTVAIKNV